MTKPIGPYQGRRISGTSNDVVKVSIATLYNFGDFSVYVAVIPARFDRETGRYYLHGPVATRLSDKVNEIVAEMQRKQQTAPEMLQGDPPLMIELKAPDLLSDAA